MEQMLWDGRHDPLAHDKYSDHGRQAKNQGNYPVNVAFAIVAKRAYQTGDANYK